MNALYPTELRHHVILPLSSAIGYTDSQSVDPGPPGHEHVQPWHKVIPALSSVTDFEDGQAVDRVLQYRLAAQCVDANTLELPEQISRREEPSAPYSPLMRENRQVQEC